MLFGVDFLFQSIAITLVAIMLLIYAVKSLGRRKRGRTVAQVRDTSLLLTQMIDGTKLVDALSGKTPSGMYYSYIVSAGNVYANRKTYGLYHVELPFYSSAHVLGLSKQQNSIGPINLEDSIMEPLDLEGDYPNYFTAYTEKTQQADSRYVMDPAAMVFTVDFCQQYDWEILNGDLYFYCDNEVPSFELIDEFVSQIRPSIASDTPVVRTAHELPYVLHYPRSMDCPVCHTAMRASDTSMYCPQHHGSLLNGKQLLDIRRNADPKLLYSLLSFKKKTSESNRALICPYCTSKMNRSRYQLSKLWIDTCRTCRFRWVDTYEYEEILGKTETK